MVLFYLKEEVLFIKFCSLASSSSGNIQYLEAKNTKIIIDAGLSGVATDKLLHSIDVDPRELDGIFITHEHKDHAIGAGIISRKYDIPIYANSDTWIGLEPIVKKITPDNKKIFDREKGFYFKDIWITPVPVYHDANDPTGFTFEIDGAKISMLSDTGWVCDDMIEKIKDADLYFIESNHDEHMLKTGTYPWHTKQRIMSTRGHLSNHNCAKVLKKLVKGEGERIVLSHLSTDNNTIDKALDTNLDMLENLGKVVEEDGEVSLEVAKKHGATRVYNLKI